VKKEDQPLMKPSARYSSNLQRGESIEDQREVCRRYIAAQGWALTKTYSDAAISGASRQRPGFLSLLNDASQRVFDVAVCEVIDHLGRRLADTADLHDQVNFAALGCMPRAWVRSPRSILG
jgi:site-specific DNA recombinase